MERSEGLGNVRLHQPMMPMNIFSASTRMPLAGYMVLTLLPCLLILLQAWIPQFVIVVMCVIYAFALFPTYYLDHWVLSGIGFHSWAAFGVLALVVAAMLWPHPTTTASSSPSRPSNISRASSCRRC